MIVSYDEIIDFVDTYEPAIDFRDKDWTLLTEYLLTNLDNHGKIKKITNGPNDVEIQFSDNTENATLHHDDCERFERLVEECKEYQIQNKLLQLNHETIIGINDGNYDELD